MKWRILWIAFAGYTVLMLWLLFGQRMAASSDGYSLSKLTENISLIPFRTITEFAGMLQGGGRSIAIINLFGNIIMFIPLGLFIPLLFPNAKSFPKTMLYAALTVICIEILQLFTMLGSLDIDDLILNLAGTSAGWLCIGFIGKSNKH